jgi:prepilin-type N-terminal cleavage/methylation domain-containing protein
MKNRNGFTLIEVMIAVILLSSVLIVLFKINGNNISFISKLKNKNKESNYITFLNNDFKYSFETNTLNLDKLIQKINLTDEENKIFKNKKLKTSSKKNRKYRIT